MIYSSYIWFNEKWRVGREVMQWIVCYLLEIHNLLWTTFFWRRFGQQKETNLVNETISGLLWLGVSVCS